MNFKQENGCNIKHLNAYIHIHGWTTKMEQFSHKSQSICHSLRFFSSLMNNCAQKVYISFLTVLSFHFLVSISIASWKEWNFFWQHIFHASVPSASLQLQTPNIRISSKFQVSTICTFEYSLSFFSLNGTFLLCECGWLLLSPETVLFALLLCNLLQPQEILSCVFFWHLKKVFRLHFAFIIYNSQQNFSIFPCCLSMQNWRRFH